MEGTLVSGGAALAASYYLHRNVESYRRLPLSLKALGIIIIVAPCLSIQAERRGLEYERSKWCAALFRLVFLLSCDIIGMAKDCVSSMGNSCGMRKDGNRLRSKIRWAIGLHDTSTASSLVDGQPV